MLLYPFLNDRIYGASLELFRVRSFYFDEPAAGVDVAGACRLFLSEFVQMLLVVLET